MRFSSFDHHFTFLDVLSHQLADEKARLQAKKEAHLAAMKVILEDNEKQRLIKLEQQRREQAEAVRLQVR